MTPQVIVGWLVALTLGLYATSPARAADDLIFSEYVEGSSNNKGLEIYNGTGNSVVLDGSYSIEAYHNGSSSPTFTIALLGSIAPGAVHVIANPAATFPSDQQDGGITFNGDDALLLKHGTNVIDSIGQVGFDPGSEWGTGLTSTQNNTLRRLEGIDTGDTDPNDAFDPAAQWQGFAQDTFDGLGSHGSVANDPEPSVTGFNPTDGAANVATDMTITVTFSEEVNLTPLIWYSISCSQSGTVTATESGGPSSYDLTPNLPFAAGEQCTVTVQADQVNDLAGQPLAGNASSTFTIAAPASGTWVINEILADPAGDLSGDANSDGTRDASADEFVEIVNNGPDATDIGDWTIADGVGVRHTFPAGTVVEAGCSVLVFGGGTPNGDFGGSLVQTASSGLLGFNNGGDSVTLADRDGSIQATYAYGGEGGADQSLTRSPDVDGADPLVQHSAVANTAYSPGTRIDGTAFVGCNALDQPPMVVSTSPMDAASDVAPNSTIEIVFSEAVNASVGAFQLVCDGQVQTFDVVPGATGYTLDPQAELPSPAQCTVTVSAAGVSDQDGASDTMTADYVFSFQIAAGASACGQPATLISAIQGDGEISPLLGQFVEIEAVVVGDFQNGAQLDGFFLQEEDGDQDGNPATSEGLFVFDNQFGVDVAVGDRVRVHGVANEFFGLTELGSISRLEVCASGQSVSDVALSFPLNSIAELEAFEGMAVRLDQTMTVTETFDLGRYGEVSLSSGGRLFQPTHVTAPGDAALAVEVENTLRRILVDDGSDMQNPDPVIFPAPALSAANTLRSGDTVTGLGGVLSFGFGEYRILPTSAPLFVAENARSTAPNLPGQGDLRVASFNVLNYFNGNGLGGGFPTSRGADTAEEFQRQRDKIIQALLGTDADIIGLMEIENDGFGPTSAIADLANGLNSQAPAGVNYAYVNPDVATIGDDEISVGLLYRSSSVEAVGAARILDDGVDPGFINSKNRPALAQTFRDLTTGGHITVAVNHLKSKGSPCDFPEQPNELTDPDTGDGQGNCNLTRTSAASALVDWLSTDPTGSGDADFLIIGDLNAYANEDPISAIKSAGYVNLISRFLGSETWSYVFFGASGYLDHALASASLVQQVTGVAEWHINADEPVALDYNTEFKSTAQQQDYYNPDPYRASDHDPVIVELALEPAVPVAVAGDLDDDGDVDRDDMDLLRADYGEPVSGADDPRDLNDDGLINSRDLRLQSQLCTRFRCATE